MQKGFPLNCLIFGTKKEASLRFYFRKPASYQIFNYFPMIYRKKTYTARITYTGIMILRALTRRPANIQLSSKLQYGDLTFDKDSRTLSTPNNSLLLTSKETELTFVFMQNPETLFSREQLILKIWGSSSEVETGNVDSYISFLRKRLKELKSSCKITTVYGAGYKLEKETC